jgi:hypothetical protein
MGKLKLNWALIVGALVVVYLIFMSSREAAVNFTRTFDKTKVKPGEAIRVTYGSNLQTTNDLWIAEMPLPTGFTWMPLTLQDARIQNITINGQNYLRLYGEGNTNVEFFITPTIKGQWWIGGTLYSSKDDTTYGWSEIAGQLAYTSTYVTSSCVAKTDVLTALPKWLKNQITMMDMIEIIRGWLSYPC